MNIQVQRKSEDLGSNPVRSFYLGELKRYQQADDKQPSSLVDDLENHPSGTINEKLREVVVTFSSDSEVDYYGDLEILSHEEGAVDLSYCRGEFPVLWNHGRETQIGITLRAIVKDGRGKAVLKFADNEYWNGVRDGIYRHISVSYEITEDPKIIKPQNDGDKWRIYVTKWRVLEISLVSMPRDDQSTGIGRGYNIDDLKNKEIKMANKVSDGHANENQAATQKNNNESAKRSAIEAGKNLDYERIKEISDMASQHGRSDLIPKYINERGLTVKDLMSEMLSDVKKGSGQAQEKSFGRSEPVISEKAGESIGLNDKERAAFSFANAIKCTVLGTRRGYELEYDVLEEMRAKDSKATQSTVIIPLEVMRAKRDIDGMMAGSAGYGAEYVETSVDSKSFIDVLREGSILDKLGADLRNGLHGNFSIPGAGNDVVAGFFGETEEIKDPTKLGTYEVTLTPKRIGALTYFSTTLLDQSSINIESYVRKSLAWSVSKVLDRAAIFGEGRKAGDGQTVLEPVGVLKRLQNFDEAEGRTEEEKRIITPQKGKLVDYSDIVELESRIASQNADLGKLTYVTSTRGRGFLKSVAELEQSGKRIWTESSRRGFGEVNGYSAMATNMWGVDEKSTLIIFGNWEDVVIGTWGHLRLDLEKVSKRDSIEAVCNLHGDAAIKRAESFAVMKAPIQL